MNTFVNVTLSAVMLVSQTVLAQTIPIQAPAPAPQVTVTAPAPQPTVQEVLLSVCESRGYGEDCAKHLLGMVWNESSNVSTAVGDAGKARGYFQIWTKLHKISVACAEELVCSSNWTIDYLERNSYPKYVSYAIQCHNSCNFPNGYAAKALRNGERLWNQPLELNQAAPVELPVKLAVK